jgi:hypothetical protein
MTNQTTDDTNAGVAALDRAVTRTTDDARARRHARHRNAAVLGLRIHAAVYVMVQILLVVVWALTSDGGHPWFLYPLLGWGIGLAAHAVAVRHVIRQHLPA